MDYTKTPIDTIQPGKPVGYFIAWDKCTQGARSHSAARMQDLGKLMSATDVARFAKVPQDGRRDFDGYRYEIH